MTETDNPSLTTLCECIQVLESHAPQLVHPFHPSCIPQLHYSDPEPFISIGTGVAQLSAIFRCVPPLQHHAVGPQLPHSRTSSSAPPPISSHPSQAPPLSCTRYYPPTPYVGDPWPGVAAAWEKLV